MTFPPELYSREGGEGAGTKLFDIIRDGFGRMLLKIAK